MRPRHLLLNPVAIAAEGASLLPADQRDAIVHNNIAALAAQPPKAPEGWQLVPIDPTEAQWSGMARDIVMWMDMNPGASKTPRALFAHLERLGVEAPDWLRNEPEMKALDHVPSKGTRAAIIYRAMLADAPKWEGK